MIILRGNETLQAVLAAAPSAVQPTALASYVDSPGLPADDAVVLQGPAPVTLVPATRGGAQRRVYRISIYNGDSGIATITVHKVTDGIAFVLVSTDVPPGYSLVFVQSAWQVTDAFGGSIPVNTSPSNPGGGGDGMTQAFADARYLRLAQINQPGGVPNLDANAQMPIPRLAPLTIDLATLLRNKLI